MYNVRYNQGLIMSDVPIVDSTLFSNVLCDKHHIFSFHLLEC